jgi:hypothetical protein
MVDWSKLQPDPGAPPAWDAQVDGCMRGTPPCTPYGGTRAWLAAAAARGAEVLVSVYGTPAWAAEAGTPCDRPGTQPRSRAPRADATAAYQAMLRSLLEVAEEEGAQVRWVSPWNEPNGPWFLAACDQPATYAALFRAAAEEAPGRLVLGELAGYEDLGTFFAALPDDVACGALLAAQHAYLRPGRSFDAVAAAREALDARPCTRSIPLWVTETGAGGAAGVEGATQARSPEACRLYDAALRRWRDDPGVDAAFHYTVREDPLFPTGLTDAAMTAPTPAFGVLRALQAGEPAAPC